VSTLAERVHPGSGTGKMRMAAGESPKRLFPDPADEPAMDSFGNIGFVHHCFNRDMESIEAGIYPVYRRFLEIRRRTIPEGRKNP
jgi:hypothetical protein